MTRYIHRPEPERWSPPRSALIAAAVLGAIALAVVAFWLIPVIMVNGHHHMTATAQLKAQNDVRASALQLLAGIVLAAGGYFTARNVMINREGQITERFTRAVDQLGSSERDVRMGAIYALERIAHDSRRDHGPIVEVLVTYVREHSAATSDDQGAPDADVQAALTVIGRRRHDFDLSTTNLDFGAINSPRAYLSSGYFRRANFNGADLRGADLSYAHLEGATFEEAKLEGCTFRRAYLDDAWLTGADFGDECDLTKARLYGTNLFRTNLEHADLSDAMCDGGTIWPKAAIPAQLGVIFDPGGRNYDIHAELSKMDSRNRRRHERRSRWNKNRIGRALVWMLEFRVRYRRRKFRVLAPSIDYGNHVGVSPVAAAADRAMPASLLTEFESCNTLADRTALATRLGLSELQLWNRYSREKDQAVQADHSQSN